MKSALHTSNNTMQVEGPDGGPDGGPMVGPMVEDSLLDMAVQQPALHLYFWRKACWDKVHIPVLEPCVLDTPCTKEKLFFL